ncbi:GNAT family N-acetyltransferase [Arthrobacter sp. SW1]|uniref:GNAT family N-acetyltransferase n=1 Tax=Arthrobacter sp. SW1 TaxID=1920889 RepID=UPI000877C751|nr:GNAT family N-acetyltransferase [Arthrobacter sp. SW1]OFI37889.1 GNAT family N-acetyltransferase [Arthrobacter sp. SW1]
MAVESAAVASGLLEELMDLAWPAPEHEELNGWVMRSAGGVTQRANSVWPRGVADDPAAALNAAAMWYRLRRQPLIFQLFDDPRYAELNALLDARRFTRQSETLLMTRSAAELPAGQGGGVEITGSPSEEWLRLWWSVDGRGGAAELEIARRILSGCPSLYAMVRDDDDAPAAVGRLALPAGIGVKGTARWGGLYCMATSAEHRRRGFARRVLAALLTAGAGEGVQDFWLMVTAGNLGAQALYAGAGFEEQGRYLYRQAPLQRALSGC